MQKTKAFPSGNPWPGLHASLWLCFNVLLVFCLGWRPCQASDNLVKAKLLYEKGQYTESLEYIEKELGENPKSAAAHYLLGNVFVTRKAYTEAIREYQSAASLDPTGVPGLYSKQALSRLPAVSKLGAPAPASEKEKITDKDGNMEKDKDSERGKNAEKDKNKDNAVEDCQDSLLKHSVRTTSHQTTESSKAMEDECEHKLAEIKKDADTKIGSLQEEMQRQIAANGLGGRQSAGSRYYNPEPLNAPIRQEYGELIQTVRDDAERRSSEVQAEYKRRALAIEQAGLNVDKAFMDGGQARGIRLNPIGTNLHVRNYESTDEASGDTVPLVAEPGKLASDSTHDKNSKVGGDSRTQQTSKTYGASKTQATSKTQETSNTQGTNKTQETSKTQQASKTAKKQEN